MNPYFSRRSGAAAVAVTLLVTACGGGESGTTTDSGERPPTTSVNEATDAPTTTATTPIATTAVGDGGHDHMGTIEVDAAAAPTLALDVTADAKSGYNVRLLTSNFVFAPEHASGDHVDGEGHAHLYVDDEKIGRVYGEWVHVNLDAGPWRLRVELNGNDHRAYAVDGDIVDVTVAVEEGTVTVLDGPAADSTTTSTTPTTAPDAEGDGGAASTTVPVDADQVIEIAVVDGAIVGDTRQEVALGSTVAIVVTSDVADELHVHGYDLYADLTPGVPATLVFPADIPGVFEVELEGAHRLLFDMAVS